MRSVVAIVETRPETVVADYGRAMTLAGLPELLGQRSFALLPVARRSRWSPGAGSPPWQLDGVLSCLEARRRGEHEPPRESPGLAAASVGGKLLGADLTEHWGWSRVLAAHDVDWATQAMVKRVVYRPERPLPALAAVLPDGFGLPACLIGRRPVLLPVPAWQAGWPLQGAVAQLTALLAPRQRRPGKIPRSEILAEIVSLAREALGTMLVVMDAVAWLVPAGPGEGRPVVRNLLLAGTDPVAVDAVALRLAGGQPENVPWMRLCQDRGVGAVGPERIRLVGGPPEQVLDAALLAHSLARSRSWPILPGVGRWFWRNTAGRSLRRRHRDGPWGRLYSDYRQGLPERERE